MRFKLPNLNWIKYLCLSVMAAGAFHAWSAQPVTLHLRNGDRITGTISSEDTNRIVLSTPWLKELSVPTAQVLKREVLPATGPTQKPPPAVGAGATAGTSSPELKKPEQLLAGELSVGTDVAFSEKNRQLYTGRAKIILAYERLKNTFEYDFSYGRTDGILSANRMDGLSKSDFDLGRRFYIYGLGGGGYDEIRKINLRYEIGPGLGYHLVKLTNFFLNTEFGVDFQRQELVDDTTTDLFFYRLAENFSWKLNSKLTLDEKFEFLPRVEDIEQYRFRLESNFRYQLMSNLSLNLTVVDQYDTQPAESVTRNDLQVRSSVGVKF
jgi:putative salt-induced outer membrane protein YdiY